MGGHVWSRDFKCLRRGVNGASIALDLPLVNREEGLQSPTNIKQHLCWKVHDHAQRFVLRSYTTHELRYRSVSIVCGLLMFFVHGQGQKSEH